MTPISTSRINDIANEWRRAVRSDSLLVKPEWLTVSESPDGTSKYLVLPDGPGALVAELIEAGAFPTRDPLSLLAQADPADDTSGKLDSLYPVVASALPGAYLPGVLQQPGSDPGALLDGLDEATASWGGRTTAVMHVPDSDPLVEPLRARGYVAVAVLAQCVLTVEWSDFDEYLRSLSQNRRTSIRRERRIFAESGMAVEEMDVREAGREMAVLHARQLRRYGHDIPEERLIQLLERIAEHLAPWCRVLAAKRDGQLEAFALCYETCGELHPKMTGFSAYAEQHFGYFNMTYYELVEHSLRHGLDKIVLGPLSYEAKVVRGARLEPRSTFVKVPGESSAAVAELAARADEQCRAHYAELA